DEALKARIRTEYPSSNGIFDWFRPFVELGIRLTRREGFFGMVLPDIILLKDYEPTRIFILEHLAMSRIDWLGMAFQSATIDAVTIVGRRQDNPRPCSIDVHVHDPGKPLHHTIAQQDFWDNPRKSFNLHLTPERRRMLKRLLEFPKLGDLYEVHEGIHSG